MPVFAFIVDIEKMVSIKGMIIRCSSVIPELKEAVFRCLVCGFYSEPVMVDRGIYNTSMDSCYAQCSSVVIVLDKLLCASNLSLIVSYFFPIFYLEILCNSISYM
jgi:hypothetical protein